MSTYEAQRPIHRVRCDVGGCGAEFEPTGDWYPRDGHLARQAAAKAGWDVPPPRGKGSRSPYDFCPDHARR
ncbi:hypothetical protein OG884_06155 [Streptosporangium sp. NBC_01755]|uniref:hypothetical protein n=1 Tax=Streptosporangium sp. NBC_01755 TaxID=2975949 RepID=UPI002DD89FA0|nr:hypothetical protein [Streptosporangium sp. NBC_01755]WSD01510.1 hypothetical protein OG884_06155 [Streptosporangium sp. NBC_01755]